MKRMIWAIIFVLFAVNVSAAAPPWEAYCKHNRYYTERDNGLTYCIFDSENKCDAKAFLNGTCGKEYVLSEDKIPCRKEKESLYWHTEKCCDGLYQKDVIGPYSYCIKLNFFQKIWWYLIHLF